MNNGMLESVLNEGKMLEKNRQEVSNVSGSTVQQANGNINNYGLGYSDVKDICRDVIRQEFEIVTKEAYDKLNKIIEEFQKRLIEKLAGLNDQSVIDKFKEPRYQFVLHDTIKEYAQSDSEEIKEDLVDVLIDRLKVGENSTEKFIIEDAIHVIPKLSVALSRLLGAILMRRMEERNVSFVFKANLAEQARLYEHLDEVTNLDIAFLHQLGCCETMHGLTRMVTIEEEMRRRYDLFFRQPTSFEEYQQFISGHPALAPGLKGVAFVYGDIDNKCRMVSLSTNQLKASLENEGRIDLWPELQTYINTLRPLDDDEIKNLLIDINPNWGKVINLFHQDNIQKLKLTPVGVYIANRIVRKEKMRVANATLKELFKNER